MARVVRCLSVVGVIACAALLVGSGDANAAARRVALVIGNSAYLHTPKLENPKNDAGDMAQTLKRLGFDVIEGRDLDKAAMDRTIRSFAETLAGASMALLFYAGHGIQVTGQNYLVPIDAKLTAAAALDFEMVRLEVVQRAMEREVATNIVILDACRDNPLARNLARALGTRSTSIGRGLAPVESGEGTLISFSTQPGNVALDGTGRNSPFTTALLKHIAVPGEDLPTILINVRNDVMAATERRQVPWEHSALTAKVYFTAPKPPEKQVELTFWMSVKDSTSAPVLQTYLDRYPNGEFATIAIALIEHYEKRRGAEMAAREEERGRQEEARKAAEVTRLEEERRSREAAIRADGAKNSPEGKGVAEKERAELIARTEELRKALDEALMARKAAKAAEEQRLAAVKAAELATKEAEEAIARKREAEKTDEPTKHAALPKIEKPQGSGGADGVWMVTWTSGGGPRCKFPGGSYRVNIQNGVVTGGNVRSGRASASGAARWVVAARADGAPVNYEGTFRGNSASGTWARPDGNCGGTFTARRG